MKKTWKNSPFSRWIWNQSSSVKLYTCISLISEAQSSMCCNNERKHIFACRVCQKQCIHKSAAAKASTHSNWIWILASGICCHLATRGSLRSGTDVGGIRGNSKLAFQFIPPVMRGMRSRPVRFLHTNSESLFFMDLALCTWALWTGFQCTFGQIVSYSVAVLWDK